MNCGYEIKWSYDPRSYGRNFCNWVKTPEKFRTSTGFEPLTSRYRCDALTNWAMKPLTLGAAHLWVPMFPWGMNQRWNDIIDFMSTVHIWSISYIISSLIHSSREHWNPQMTSSQCQWLHSSVGQSVAPVSRGHGFKPRWSPEFFRRPYPIAKIASITARIIASLDHLIWIVMAQAPQAQCQHGRHKCKDCMGIPIKSLRR